jgi:hypothetical protein
MRIARTDRYASAYIAMEAFISIVLIATLGASYAVLQRSSAALNRTCLARQRCILAAQAQLDCLAATGRTIEDAEVARLWPGVRTEVRRSPGQGLWHGLVLAAATATAEVDGRSIKVELARYLPPGRGGPP